MQHGHSAWKYSTDMQYVHVTQTRTMDMQHGEGTWMQLGHAALKRTLNMQQGHAARTCSMDMQDGHDA
jgi:hypothetical protein